MNLAKYQQILCEISRESGCFGGFWGGLNEWRGMAVRPDGHLDLLSQSMRLELRAQGTRALVHKSEYCNRSSGVGAHSAVLLMKEWTREKKDFSIENT